MDCEEHAEGAHGTREAPAARREVACTHDVAHAIDSGERVGFVWGSASACALVEVSRADEADILSSLAFHDRVKATLLEIFRAAERGGQLAPPWDAYSASSTLYYLLVGAISEHVRRDEAHADPEALRVVLALLRTVAQPLASGEP